MAAFAQDSFTDSNATNLADHTGETGTSWAKVTGISGNAFINGNKLENEDGPSDDVGYYASGTPGSADYGVEADYSWINSQLASWQILARVDTSTGDFYTAYYRRGSNTFRIEKKVSGSFTTLASGSGGLPSSGTPVKIRLNLSGSNLELSADNVPQLTVLDATISAAGRVGIGAVATGGAGPRLRWDNFLATDASAGTVELDPADGTHGHNGGHVSLTQVHGLGIDGATSAHTADVVTLAQHSEIIVSVSVHVHAADAASLAVGSGIVIADGAHGHAAQSLTLEQQHVLAVLAALHGHAAVQVSIMPEGIFPPTARRLRATGGNRTLKADDGHSASASQRRKIQPEL